MLTSCNEKISRSWELLGSNFHNIYVVLKHFEDNPNPLKYEAAKFLMENMPYHYTFKDDAVDRLDELYLNTSKETLNKRT